MVSVSSCRKQAKCGCGKDRLFSLTNELVSMSSIIYAEGGVTASYQEGSSTYYFCNPSAMYSKYQELAGETRIKLSGDVFWECNYLYSSSNSYYYQYYKVYNIEVTNMESELYGK